MKRYKRSWAGGRILMAGICSYCFLVGWPGCHPVFAQASGVLRIEFEDFLVPRGEVEPQNLGGAYRDDEVDVAFDPKAGNNHVVGWTLPGEGIEYSPQTIVPGDYTVRVRVSGMGAGGRFSLAFQESGLSFADNDWVPFSVPDTGAWNQYSIVERQVTLEAQISPRCIMNGAGPSGFAGALDWFELEPVGVSTPQQAFPSGIPTPLPGIVEFEDFDMGDGGDAYVDLSAGNAGNALYRSSDVDIAASTRIGSSYVIGWTPAGEWLEYTVNIDRSGSYDVITRVAAVGGGGQFRYLLDGSPISGNLSVPNTGSWSNYQDVAATMELSSGIHTVRVEMVTEGPSGNVGAFDSFTISSGGGVSSQSAYPAETPWSIPGTVQVENYDVGGSGVAYNDSTGGNAGGTYRSDSVDIANDGNADNGRTVGWTAAGEWLEYTVNISQSGTYSIGTKVAAVGSGGRFRIRVDGSDKTGQLSVPNTGAWNSYQTVSKTGVSLSSGIHTVRVEMVSAGSSGHVGAFDSFSISAGGTPTQSPYGGSPWPILRGFAARDYDQGGEGVAYHDSDAINQGGDYRSVQVSRCAAVTNKRY